MVVVVVPCSFVQSTLDSHYIGTFISFGWHVCNLYWMSAIDDVPNNSLKCNFNVIGFFLSNKMAKEICVQLIGLCLCDFRQSKKNKNDSPQPNINSIQIVWNKVTAYNTIYLFVWLQITYHTIQSICIQWTKPNTATATALTTW